MFVPKFIHIAEAITLLIVLLSLYLAYKFVWIPYSRISFYRKQGIPGFFYPLLGMMKRARDSEKNHKDTMHHYRDLARKNPNVRAEVANFGSRVCLILYDPKLIKEFYNNQSNYYQKVNSGGALNTLMGTGLLLAEGQQWKNHRRILSNMFHFDFLKNNIPVVVSTTREFLSEVKAGSMKEIRVMDEIQKITGEIVGRVFFGENLNNYKIDNLPLTLYLANLTAGFGPIFRNPLVFFLTFMGGNPEWVSVYKQHVDKIKAFRQFCFKIIQDRKNSQTKGGHDLLGVMLETQKSAIAEDRFSDEDIINEFVTFFIAGMDTTGHLVTMALYLLNKHPEYISKLEKEIVEHYDKTDPVTIDSLNKMDIMHGVLKEALRFYTPAPTIVPRLVQKDHSLLDVKVLKGMSVRPTPLYNYLNENYFEEAEKFKPERWAAKKEFSQAFVDIPFSAGSRNCIGQHLAMIEAKVITAEFVKMFNFKIVPEDYDLIMTDAFLYEPKTQILMNLTPK